MVFGMLKKLDTTKMIKEMIILSLSYLHFPPKHLTALLLVKSCFSLQSNEKYHCPLSQELLWVYFPVQMLLPSEALGNLSATVTILSAA